MEKTESMKKFEAETGKQSAIVKSFAGGQALEMKSYPKLGPYDYNTEYLAWLEAKATITDQAIEKFQEIITTQCDEISMLKEKATAYDRLMSGGKFTMKEIANIKKRPVAIDKDGTVSTYGAEPHLARSGFAGYPDCWVNDANDYEEIPESFVEIPDDCNWKDSLTMPDGWEEV